jgi:hypothetical protein
VVDRLGPLDGLLLYYEETEWLRQGGVAGRASRGRRRASHFRAGHATRTGRGAVEAASRERFFDRNYGAASRWLLRRYAAGEASTEIVAETVVGPRAVPERRAELWLISTFRHLMPAVGVVGRPTLPGRSRGSSGGRGTRPPPPGMRAAGGFPGAGAGGTSERAGVLDPQLRAWRRGRREPGFQ